MWKFGDCFETPCLLEHKKGSKGKEELKINLKKNLEARQFFIYNFFGWFEINFSQMGAGGRGCELAFSRVKG